MRKRQRKHTQTRNKLVNRAAIRAQRIANTLRKITDADNINGSEKFLLKSVKGQTLI